MSSSPDLSIAACYRVAWQAFAKWWIPLCLISAGILAFELVPRFLTHDRKQRLQRSTRIVLDAVLSRDQTALQKAAIAVQADAEAFAKAVAQYAGMALPFVAVLWSLLLLFANRAVKNKQSGRSLRRVLSVALWRIGLAAVKLAPLLGLLGYVLYLRYGGATIQEVRWGFLLFLLLLSPFWFLFTYTKFFFVPLLMFEFELGGWQACCRGWQQTKGFFFKLLAIILINSLIQSALGLTVIGAIPGLSFIETVRAAAFRMTLPPDGEQPPTENATTEDAPDQ